MKRLAAWLLRWAERFYLHAHGWEQQRLLGENLHGAYRPPADYPFKDKGIYTRNHAVNAQRQVYAHTTMGLLPKVEQPSDARSQEVDLHQKLMASVIASKGKS